MSNRVRLRAIRFRSAVILRRSLLWGALAGLGGCHTRESGAPAGPGGGKGRRRAGLPLPVGRRHGRVRGEIQVPQWSEAGLGTILESLGRGVVLFDYDRDGSPDLFFPGGGYFARLARRSPDWVLACSGK